MRELDRLCSLLIHGSPLPWSPRLARVIRVRRTRLFVAGLVPVVAAVTALTSAGTAATGPAQQAGAVSTGTPGSPIKHVIEIMVENHTFDNLFGSFPGADGIRRTRRSSPRLGDGGRARQTQH